MRQKLLAIGIIIILLFCIVLEVGAQTPPPTPSDDQINAIAGELYCPVCENIPLDVCGTQACEQWRGVIRDKLAEGWSKEQIKQYFVDQYGDRVLAAPPAKGFNWLVYIVPPLVILVGIFVLLKTVKIIRKPEKIIEGEQPVDPAQDGYIAFLEDELKKR